MSSVCTLPLVLIVDELAPAKFWKIFETRCDGRRTLVDELNTIGDDAGGSRLRGLLFSRLADV